MAMEALKPTRVYWELEDAYNRGVNIVSEQGGTRSGKTYNTVMWLCTKAINCPRLKINIVRATMPTIEGTVYEDFVEIMEKLGYWDALHKDRKHMKFVTPSKSTIRFFATEEESKARGRKANITFINEATELEYEVYKQLRLRTEGNKKLGYHRFVILDYNPTYTPDTWIYDLNTNPVYDDVRYFFKTTYKDNPYLDDDQIKDIESLQATDKRGWRIYGEGEMCMAEGLIFDQYFVCDDIPERLKRKAIVGVDWGFKDPFALVLVAIDNKNRELYLKEMCYKRELSEDQIMREMKRPELQGRLFIPDPRDPGKIARMRREGLHVRLPKTTRIGGKTPIVSGIQKMKGYKIFITADSKNGIMEADNYTYERDRNGNWTDEPDKKHFNHFWDAARYVVSTEGTLPGHGITRGVRVRN